MIYGKLPLIDEAGWSQNDRDRYTRRVRYRQRIGLKLGLEVLPAPSAYGGNPGYTYAVHWLDCQQHWPFALVDQHGLGYSVTMVGAMRGGAPFTREYVADHARSFTEACRIAYPRLKALDAVSRLTGLETVIGMT